MMAENGIINNLGVSKRSATGMAAMVMIMKLSTSDGSFVIPAMVGITLISVVYMIMDELKDKRHGKNEKS